jgi:ribose transport system permease protein
MSETGPDTGRQRPLTGVLADNLTLFVLIVLVLLVGLYDRNFLSASNLLTVSADTMTLFLMASGVTLVIMMGGIDLSIQAVASMTSCILAAYLPHLGFWAVPLAALGGLVAGFAGGFVSTRLRIPSFIATLAVSGVVTTAAYYFSDTRSVNIPAELSATYLGWAVGEFLGVPAEIWLGLVFLILLSAVLSLTPFGRLVRAIGMQERAVLASGIDVDRQKLIAYTISGGMAGMAGIVMAARLGSGSPTLANEFLLPAIACIIVGGTAVTGGVGSIWRTFLGALIVQVIRIGMTFIGISVFAQQIVFGILLVAAVAITMDRSKVTVVK